MRLFVAINLPPDIRDAVYADAAPLRAATTAVRWVAPALLHVTIKFLGEQAETLVPDLQRAIRTVVERHAAIDVHVNQPGAFPNFRQPRVVWVGMTGETELCAIARDLDQTFAPFGIPAESRPFKAHLTLGRVKGEMASDQAKALAMAAGVPRQARSFSVRTVDLMHSELRPGGPRYSVLAAVPLHARGA